MNVNDQLTTEHLTSILMVGAVELANRWLDGMPDKGAVARTHLAAGAGLEILFQIMPTPALGLRLVDSDGSYVALQSKTFPT